MFYIKLILFNLSTKKLFVDTVMNKIFKNVNNFL